MGGDFCERGQGGYPLRVRWWVMVVVLWAWSPLFARADMFKCERNGEIHYTNVRPRGKAARGCKRILKTRRTTRPKVQRAPDVDRHGYDKLIRRAAERYALPVALVKAVMSVESAFHPGAVSPVGAVGLMQLMPRTARSMGVRNPFDPKENIMGGARFLRFLADRYGGNLLFTIAAYNAGQGAVDRYKGVPPYAETQRYVRRVLKAYHRYLSSPNI